MTMKSMYIVYITNCFLWTMSDNKTYLILSYLITSTSQLVADVCHRCVTIRQHFVKYCISLNTVLGNY